NRSQFFAAVAKEEEAAGALPFFAEVIPPDKEDRQAFVDVRVDPHSVLFTSAQREGRQQAQVELYTLALEAKNNKVVTIKSDIMTMNLTAKTFDELMKSGLSIRQKIDLSPGSYKLRVGVRDTKSNLIGTLTALLDISDRPTGGERK